MRLVEPLGLLAGPAAADAVAKGRALFLAGGPLAFSLVRLLPGGDILPACDTPAPWRGRLDLIVRPPPAWAGLDDLAVMGIVNATPDSFSDGGDHADPATAVAAGRAMAAAGADIVDIGGESTRPNAAPVSPRTERDRILPIIAGLAGVKISVDTRNAGTMAAALAAGASIVNDVSALAHDPDAAAVVARAGCPVVLMHMRGEPATMHLFARYDDVAVEVVQELEQRIRAAEAAGIMRKHIAIDPGIGFAKTGVQNLDLLRRLPLLVNLGCRIVVGVSRKRFLGTLAGVGDPRRRGPGSLAAALHAAARGAGVLRVHDVAETAQAIRVWRELARNDPATRYAAPGNLETTPV